MSGGMAYVYDAEDAFPPMVNPDSIVFQRLASKHWEEVLKGLVVEHAARTGSAHAQAILKNWNAARGRFWQVCPKEMLPRLPHALTDEAVAAA
jgi:glutamate synthase (NADPH/NADH) large chain